MKFSKEFLIDTLDSDNYVDKGFNGTRRWSVGYWGVFEHKGKFYKTHYSTGATEQQDESPYEYEDDEIECPEVAPVSKQIIVYELVK